MNFPASTNAFFAYIVAKNRGNWRAKCPKIMQS
jgi:hypothetical protein